MSKRITTCIKCQYFYLHDHITGKMRCANNARTCANDIPEELEEIQLDCEYWTEKMEPIEPEPEDNVQLSIDLRLYR